MKTPLRHWAAAVGAVAVCAFTSCTYDPYYSSAGGGYSTVGGSYSAGYGDGYGYGGSGFSTSVFVGTGNPQWGYDPYCYSYYDYRRRCYYDPYLLGYYPIGYRPPVIIGCPHPYGWRPGRGYCPPPRVVRNVTVVNYRNREIAYRNSHYSWSKHVRQQPVSHGRVVGQRPDNSHSSRPTTGSRPSVHQSHSSRPNTDSRPSVSQSQSSSQVRSRETHTQNVKPENRAPNTGRSAVAINTSATSPSRRPVKSYQETPGVQTPSRQSPSAGKPKGRQSSQGAHSGGNSSRRQESKPTKEEKNASRGFQR